MLISVEMVQGTLEKKEVDKVTGLLRVDRMLTVQCPFDYGFINNTLADDGDALDVFVVNNPKGERSDLAQVSVTPYAVAVCRDGGKEDHKVFAWEAGEELSEADKREAESAVLQYLTTYKEGFQVLSYTENMPMVLGIIEDSLKAFQNKEKQ